TTSPHESTPGPRFESVMRSPQGTRGIGPGRAGDPRGDIRPVAGDVQTGRCGGTAAADLPADRRVSYPCGGDAAPEGPSLGSPERTASHVGLKRRVGRVVRGRAGPDPRAGRPGPAGRPAGHRVR